MFRIHLSARGLCFMVCIVVALEYGTGRSDVTLNGSDGLSVELSQTKSWTIGQLYFDGYGICLYDGSGQGTVIRDTDWAGSVHGRETVYGTRLWMDGVEVPFTDSATYEGSAFVFERRSTLGGTVDLVSRTELMGTELRERVTLTRLDSPSDLTVVYGFLGSRANTLTEYASFDETSQILDQGVTNANDATFAQLSGTRAVAQYDSIAEIGLVTMIRKGADLGLSMFIWDRAEDNKLYSRFSDIEHSSPGEVFELEQALSVFQVGPAGWKAAASALVSRLTPLTGDADDNGIVDAADYIALKKHMGQGSGATTASGDYDEDGDVDWDDLQLLRAHYGDTSEPVSTIPEPATLSMLAMGGLTLLRRRRGQGKYRGRLLT